MSLTLKLQIKPGTMKEFFNVVLPIGAVIAMVYFCTQGSTYRDASHDANLNVELHQVQNQGQSQGQGQDSPEIRGSGR